eukprot:TRINITY_DN47839_c0_g1_i1.p1 TRINITY_DN47839_c0_g1~~TRINITY_DN47839_c0_g1_i1.p1  ORF type:complete len:361 (-),score=75.37 TRINITY_DN47839_c0_g1_i1:71-1153(-)
MTVSSCLCEHVTSIGGAGPQRAGEAVVSRRHPGASDAACDTIVFVDVDGVLNLAVLDPNHAAPIAFDRGNVSKVARHAAEVRRVEGQLADEIQRVLEMSNRIAADEDERLLYTELAHDEASQLSELYVQRLASLIQAARCKSEQTAGKCTVVLSSSWRKPQHRKKVVVLEAMLSSFLDSPFVFDAQTALSERSNPAGRLQGIQRFLKDYCSGDVVKRLHAKQGSLRVLVLEDFIVNPLQPGGWACDEVPMDSALAVEAYLGGWLPRALQVDVKLVHPYEEWTTESGLFVQAAPGLTAGRFRSALEFLEASSGNGESDLKAGLAMESKQPLERAAKRYRMSCVPADLAVLDAAHGGHVIST